MISSTAPLKMHGWAVDGDAKQLAGGVELVVDGRAYQTEYKLSREDVATVQRLAAYANAGFRVSLPVDQLEKGEHTLSVRVISNDGKSFREGEMVKLTLQ